ncbi:RNA polymerase sigma factor [Microbacterium lushaniae]|nr:RNA polymerase sigma factor [Microbacterium lushaniae]KAA9152545.1 RNA polymerase sigma factor [Microbacterium lushaniae]
MTARAPADPRDGPAGARPSDVALAEVVRAENARLVRALAGRFDLDVAEEAVADAVAEALRDWRARGIPPRPGAWLATAARHIALDRVRRDTRYREKLAERGAPPARPAGERTEADERLPLLFGCCHPALSPEAQLALTLRAVCGLTAAQIAALTFEPVARVGQRIVRAKRKISAARIPLRIPDRAEFPARLDTVLAVVASVYTRAHLLDDADARTDRDAAEDAIWLARVVASALPAEPEALGALALLLLDHARDQARSLDGEIVLLAAQDRGRWDRAGIAEGLALLHAAAALHRPGRWQLQAAIAACHAEAGSAAATDWRQILVLYELLLRYDASPVVRLNRAVALAEVAGPGVALAEVDLLPLDSSHLWHAVRADLLGRLGRGAEAAAANARAAGLARNDAERRLLRTRLPE